MKSWNETFTVWSTFGREFQLQVKFNELPITSSETFVIVDCHYFLGEVSVAKIQCALSVSQSEATKQHISTLIRQETFEGLGTLALYAGENNLNWLKEAVLQQV